MCSLLFFFAAMLSCFSLCLQALISCQNPELCQTSPSSSSARDHGYRGVHFWVEKAMTNYTKMLFPAHYSMMTFWRMFWFLQDLFIIVFFSAEITAWCPDLWILEDFLGIVLVAVYVQPDGCPGAACATETENDPGTVREDDPEALRG